MTLRAKITAYIILIPAAVILFLLVVDANYEPPLSEPIVQKDTILKIKAPDATAEQQVVIQQAGELLFEVCDGLKSYASDIEEIEASVGEIGTRNAGWVNGVNFRIKILDDPKSIPNQWRAWGHNIFYSVVGGNQPGIDIGKETAGWFCGVGYAAPFIDDQRGGLVDELG